MRERGNVVARVWLGRKGVSWESEVMLHACTHGRKNCWKRLHEPLHAQSHRKKAPRNVGSTWGETKKKVAFSLSALLAIRHNRLLHGNPSFVFVGLVVAASFSAGNHDVLRRVLPVFLFLSWKKKVPSFVSDNLSKNKRVKTCNGAECWFL